MQSDRLMPVGLEYNQIVISYGSQTSMGRGLIVALFESSGM